MIVLLRMIAGQSVQLTQQIAHSGEGTVWQTNLKGYLAKLYHTATPDRIKKLQVMVAHPPRDPMTEHGHITFAWPHDLLQDSQGQCLGFLMPEVDSSVKLSTIYNAKLRSRKAPRFNWYYLHTAALNIALAMQSLHQEEYVVGDVKPQNILVNNQALVSVIDADSFQVRDPHTRELYRCLVGSEGFTPAELLGQDLANVDQTEIHDRFRLAVIIYLLLFGDQPFKGRWVGQGESPQPSELIKSGYWPFGKGSLIQPGPHTISLSIVHPELQDCFHRCFSKGHRQPQERPSAADWVRALRLARKDLTTCKIETNHLYSLGYGRCYWCDRKAKLNIDIFSPKPKPKVRPAPKPRGIASLKDPPPLRRTTLGKRKPFNSPPLSPAWHRSAPIRLPMPSKAVVGSFLCLSSLAGLAMLLLPDLRGSVPQSLERSLERQLTRSFDWLAAALPGAKTVQPARVSVDQRGHGDRVSALAISPDGQFLVSGSQDFMIKIWNLQTGKLLRTLSGHYEPITSVQFANRGSTLISRSISGKVLLWDLATGETRNRLNQKQPTGQAVAAKTQDARGTILASLTWDGTILLRDLRTNKVRQIEPGSVSTSQAIAVTPDAQTLISSTSDGQIKLWDVPTGQFQRSFPNVNDWEAIKTMQFTSALAVSQNGRQLASGGFGGAIHLWNMQQGTLIRALPGHSKAISALALSANNAVLVSGSSDHLIKIWRLQDARLLQTLKGHRGEISALSVSPDSKLLISGSADHTIRIWQLATGQLLRTLGKP
jgi:WD40 repeat protein/serine/threonine protein kinase